MQHFFVTPAQVSGDEIRIEGSDVNHIANVLRMKKGEQLMVSDGNNKKYICRIEEMNPKKDLVLLTIEETMDVDTELPSRIYLFQGLPKADKMELIIQKAVELGAYQVIPVMTKRAIVKIDPKKEAKKIARWQQIAESAAKQSGRGYIPEVKGVMSFREALQYAGDIDVNLIPYELAEGMNQTKEIIRAIEPGQSIGIFIGPEGGFEKEEVELAMDMGAKAITLGKRILRTETAGMTTLSVLMFHLEGERG
ncbi:MAG: 16S rRNA (uracil(1498)-N(3))-methyltransferase [Dorea sp.]|nr:16S rRNA (uracil(1498)-N(3))-methyltransferase [Dorea sp.]